MVYIALQEVIKVAEARISSDLLRGHTDTIILKLLLSGDKYGYEISKMIHANSDGEYELKEATMYSSLKRLEVDGCITSYWGDETRGGRRKYYSITEKGKEIYSENQKNWEYAKRILDKML
jgi:PadR family transcriptional regulator PadR